MPSAALPSASFDAVIFDCDGVLADSEGISNRVLAEMVQLLGCPLSVQEVRRRFVEPKPWQPEFLDDSYRVEDAAPRPAAVLIRQALGDTEQVRANQLYSHKNPPRAKPRLTYA